MRKVVVALIVGCGSRTAPGLLVQGAEDAAGPIADAGADSTSREASMPPDASEPCLPVDAGPPGPMGFPQEACVVIESDPRNCGACGNDCHGGACVGGVCGPVPSVLASQQWPSYVVVDTTNVYWLDSQNIVPGAAGAGQLMSCAITGCNHQPTALWNELYPPAYGLAVQQGRLWWPVSQAPIVDAIYGPDPQVLTLPVSGCPAATSFYDFRSGFPGLFAVDESNVYWVDSRSAVGVFACALTGCGGSPSVVAPDTNVVTALGVGPAGIYWVDAGGPLETCPKTGCTAPQVIAANANATFITADATNVYWIDPGTPNASGPKVLATQWLSGAVRSCPVTGCHGDPMVLASYPTWLPGFAIAVRGADVFWTAGDVSGTFGQVVRCSVTGCGGVPTVVGSTIGGGGSVGLAVDDANVYWSDPGSGTILEAPR
jgi:hypothetical protein